MLKAWAGKHAHRRRAFQIQGAGGDGGARSEALRLTGPSIETIKLEVEIDATDQLEFPADNPDTTEFGIHPQLAALETLIHPNSANLLANSILSNIDRESFAASNRKLGVEFDAVYTAQDIGSYKPSLANFHYLQEHVKQDCGVEAEDLLHTAQSLYHDHECRGNPR